MICDVCRKRVDPRGCHCVVCGEMLTDADHSDCWAKEHQPPPHIECDACTMKGDMALARQRSQEADHQ